MTTSTFCNPVALQSADPWVYRHSDGHYYFMRLRASRIQKFGWNRDGTPDFGVPFSDDHALQVPSGE